MKKLFQEPEMELLKLYISDILTTSPTDGWEDLDENELPRL